jgi:phosphonate transport system substrate-binding protein
VKYIIAVVLLPLLLCGCTHKRGELGSADNPIKFYFVPSVDVRLLEDTSKALKIYLEAHTPWKYKISIPQSYIAIVEAFGTNRADIASLNTYGYIIAHEKYGVEARLMTERFGDRVYQAQFLARSDSGIKKIEDINGKKMAFVDPASISGYLLPMKYLKDHHIKPKETVFAMKHDNVVTMVYQGQVDAGVTFYSPPNEGKIQDARRLVKAQFPDVEQKVKIIGLSSDIPNDPIIFRKDMPEEMKRKICDEMIKFAKTDEGQHVLKQLSSVTGLVPATDKDYDETRAAVKALGGIK